MRALLLVPRGSRLTATLSTFLRDKGFEPFVLSSMPADGGTALRAVCAGLGIECEVSASAALTAEEVVARARAVPDCRFCFSVSDEQRLVMAYGNEALGAHDISPTAARQALDKHLMRQVLVRHGLSRLRPFLLSDAELRERLDRGERHIVKPRTGAGSLCVRAVTSWDEVRAQAAAFLRGPGEGDLWATFFNDNELVAETFFDGRELSVEMFRQGGRTLLSVEHEKTVLDFTDETVLERGFVSPPVTLSAAQVRAAKALADSALGALELDEGCYHVEVRVDAEDRCEIIEVNPRVGGGYLFESVRQQVDRSMGSDWVDGLVGTPVPAAGERRCGAYLQNLYPEPGRMILGHEPNPRVPAPDQFAEVLRTGSIARADRADRAAMAMWTTDLATHGEVVARITEDCVLYVYAKGLTGRPLMLVFEPTDDEYEVVDAADRDGMDVVVFHTLPLPASGPYAASRRSMAAAYEVASWSDTEACLAQVLRVCAGATVAGIHATGEQTRELRARVEEHFRTIRPVRSAAPGS